MRRVPFKSRLAIQSPLYGIWAALGEAVTAEVCAAARFDWICIDAEHGPNSTRSVLAQLQAVAAYPVDPVVRLPNHDRSLIKRYLDIGATSLLVPFVDSAEQAADIVSATRYPPMGQRGVGAGLGRVSAWGADADYLTVASEAVTVIAQIESEQGLQSLERICETPGVDAVFFGPADIAASLGALGDVGNPKVCAAVLGGIETATALGMPSGVYTSDPGFISAARKAGTSLIAACSDVSLLAGGAREARARLMSD